MQIVVKTVTGEGVKFDVETLNSVDNVNTSIFDKETKLSSSGTAVYCAVVEGRLQVSFKTITGKRIVFQVESSHTSENVEIFLPLRSVASNSLGKCFTDVKMQTVVKTLTGKTVTLEVESFTNMDNVRSKVQDTEGICLRSSVLHCNFLDIKVQISLKSVTGKGAGKTIVMDVESLDGTIDNVQTSIKRTECISMQIFVKTYSGKTITLDVEPFDTIGIVQSKTAAKDGVLSRPSRLLFEGRFLDDDRTIADYAIPELVQTLKVKAISDASNESI